MSLLGRPTPPIHKKPASQTPAYLVFPFFTIRLSCGVFRKTKRTGQIVICLGMIYATYFIWAKHSW
jgi:hypothetical protein